MSNEVGAWCGWCCRSPSSGNRGAASPAGGDGCTFPWAPSIHAHRTTRPAAFFLCSHSRHFLETINLGSDWKVLKALALAVLQLWPLAAGAAYRLNQLRYWGIHPSFGFLEEPETNGVVERYNQCWRLEKLAYRTPLDAREEYALRHAG